MYIKGELTTAHKHAFIKNYMNTSDEFKKLNTSITIVVTLLLLVITLLVKPTFEPILLGIYFTSALLVALLVSTVFGRVIIGKPEKEDNDTTEPFTLRLTEEGIFFEKELGKMFLEWTDIKGLSSDGRTFFLYFASGPTIIIPKDVNVPETKLNDMLLTYVDESKIESAPKTETKRLKKRAITFSLIAVLVLLSVIQFMYIQPQNEIEVAVKEVNALFVDADVTSDWEINKEIPYKIKDSTDQRKIDRAYKAVNNIDETQITEENYMLIFALTMSVLEAQEQLDEREGQ